MYSCAPPSPVPSVFSPHGGGRCHVGPACCCTLQFRLTLTTCGDQILKFVRKSISQLILVMQLLRPSAFLLACSCCAVGALRSSSYRAAAVQNSVIGLGFPCKSRCAIQISSAGCVIGATAYMYVQWSSAAASYLGPGRGGNGWP